MNCTEIWIPTNPGFLLPCCMALSGVVLGNCLANVSEQCLVRPHKTLPEILVWYLETVFA